MTIRGSSPHLLATLAYVLLLGSSLPIWADSRPTKHELEVMGNWTREIFSSDANVAYSSESWVDSRLNRSLPFSFVYDGTPSASLLPQWRVSHAVSEIDSNRTRHVLRFSDPKTGLMLTCDAVRYSDYPTVDYVLYFENTGTQKTPILTEILPLNTRLGLTAENTPRLHYSRGGGNSPEDYRLFHGELEKGKPFTLSAGGGRPSNIHMPWFNLDWQTGGLLVAIGWSGQWRAAITRGDTLEVQAGMEDSLFFLRPGEKVRTPRIVLTYWTGADVFRGFNIGRHLMIDHYMPRVDGQLVFPPVSKPTAYDELELDPWKSNHGEQNQMEIIRQAQTMGIEYFWLDAYWFKNYFPTGVGNWQFPIMDSVRESFPNGLKPLADAAHQAGMKFILWFEPERVYPGTYVDREKPSWVIRVPDGKQGLYNLANNEASEWMTRYIVDVLREFDVDVCRIDFNIDPLSFWRHSDTEERKGTTEIGYVQNLYRMWDAILKSKPGLWMDNCASGGRRIDIETASRALPLWRSDFNDTPRRRTEEIGAIADQVMTMGLSLYVPLHSGPVWRPQPYYWRSAMSAGNAIYWDIRPNKDTGQYSYDRVLLRKAIAECKALRPYYLGDYYPLTDLNADPKGWAAYQYIRTEHGDGFAVFFRRPESPFPVMEAELRELAPDQRYRVTWYWDYEATRTEIMTGAELAHLTAQIEEKPGSLLIRFARAETL